MKNLLLIFACFLSSSLSAQTEKNIILQFNKLVTRGILYQNSDNFYIDTVIDKRVIKNKYIGFLPYGILERMRPVKFETDNVGQEIYELLKFFVPKRENKTALIMELNVLEVGKIRYTVHLEEEYVMMDISFYTKNENGERILVGNYHGKSLQTHQAQQIQRKYLTPEERICESLRKGLNSIGSDEIKNYTIKKAIPQDTAYIPKAGFYFTYLDYLYNTPSGTQYDVKIEPGESIFGRPILKLITPAPVDSFFQFGYSDGKHFYNSYFGFGRNESLFGNRPAWHGAYKVNTKGRFILMNRVAFNQLRTYGGRMAKLMDLESNELYGGEFVFGNNMIDMLTGDVIRVNSDYFLVILRAVDENIFNEYVKAKGTFEAAEIAVNKINGILCSKVKEIKISPVEEDVEK